MSHLYQHCFLHETDGFVKYSLSKVWPRSILAFHPCCQGMSSLSQLWLCDLSQSIPIKKKKKKKKTDPGDKRWKKKPLYFYNYSLVITAEPIYSYREGEREREHKEQRKEKNGGTLIHYTLCTYPSYLRVSQLPGNQHNSSVSPGKLKLNKTLFIPLSHSPILPCHEQSIPNGLHNGHLLYALNTSDWADTLLATKWDQIWLFFCTVRYSNLYL